MSAPGSSHYAVRGNLLLDHGLVPGSLLIDGGMIVDVCTGTKTVVADVPVFDAPIVSPGFIDLQVNGGFGYDVTTEPSAVSILSARLPETGVTSFMATVITSPIDGYAAISGHFAGLKSTRGARPLGLHLEGPLLSPYRPGAHSQTLITAADSYAFESLIDDAVPEKLLWAENVTRATRKA